MRSSPVIVLMMALTQCSSCVMTVGWCDAPLLVLGAMGVTMGCGDVTMTGVGDATIFLVGRGDTL